MADTFHLVREDFIINPSALRLGGSKPASDAAFRTNFRALSFSGTAENECFFDVQVPHGRKPGSNLDFHAHWTPSGIMGVGDTVIWKLTYIVANIGGDFPNAATLVMTHTADGTEDSATHLMTSQVSIPGESITESAIIKCRLWRDVADTYASAVFLHSADLHVYKDRIGGRI